MKWMCIAALAIAAALPARAQTSEPGAEEKELQELMSVLQEETEIATKTRMNSDYVPGIVTVLHGDELEALGVNTAWEALGLVAGIQAVRDERGSPAVIVRGIDFPFNQGNILVLINSTPLSRYDAGINSSALLIPVEQVERIEIIRGPGSVVYGDFAFMGLVNVITRKEGTRVFGRLETPHPSIAAGARVAARNFAVNLSHYTSDDAPLPTPDTGDHRWFGQASYERGAFSLGAQVAKRESSTPRNAALTYDETSWVAEARYGRELARGVRAEGRVTFLSNDINNFTSALKGDLHEVGVDLVVERLRRHSLLFGIEHSTSTIDEAFHRRPGSPPGTRPATVAAGESRRVLGVTLQDRIDLRDDITVTAGARYDRYSDLHSRLTPRLAVVWRATDRHIFKAQYAEGYRPPTFFELYETPVPNARYPFEVNATRELNYVFRGATSVLRATLFRSTILDMIQPGGRVIADNAYANGVELEWTRQLGPRWKVDANVSALDTDDPRFGNQGAAIVAPKWLSNLSALFRPTPSLVLGARWNHVADRTAGEGYDTVDLTLSRQNLFVRGLDLRLALKNGLDDEVVYLSPRPNGGVGRFVYPGRAVSVQLSWRR